MATIWQIEKMRTSQMLVADLSLRENLFDHGDVRTVIACDEIA